jgi:hypothetical protein
VTREQWHAERIHLLAEVDGRRYFAFAEPSNSPSAPARPSLHVTEAGADPAVASARPTRAPTRGRARRQPWRPPPDVVAEALMDEEGDRLERRALRRIWP